MKEHTHENHQSPVGQRGRLQRPLRRRYLPLAQAAEPVDKPVKARVHGVEPCCGVTAINQATGVVTLKDLKTGNISQVTVTDKAKLKNLKIGQQVGSNL